MREDGMVRANYFCNHCGNFFVLLIEEKRRVCSSCGSNLIAMSR